MSNDQPNDSVWRKWWRELQDDRPGRAELRRCGTIADAAFVPSFHLLRRMKGNLENEQDLRRLSLIAAVLSHVDDDVTSNVSLATQMASGQGEKPVVSDSRFRQLLRTGEFDFTERLHELVRVLRQLGGRADVNRLANDLWWWNERTKRQWALDYFERAMPTKKPK